MIEAGQLTQIEEVYELRPAMEGLQLALSSKAVGSGGINPEVLYLVAQSSLGRLAEGDYKAFLQSGGEAGAVASSVMLGVMRGVLEYGLGSLRVGDSLYVFSSQVLDPQSRARAEQQILIAEKARERAARQVRKRGSKSGPAVENFKRSVEGVLNAVVGGDGNGVGVFDLAKIRGQQMLGTSDKDSVINNPGADVFSVGKRARAVANLTLSAAMLIPRQAAITPNRVSQLLVNSNAGQNGLSADEIDVSFGIPAIIASQTLGGQTVSLPNQPLKAPETPAKGPDIAPLPDGPVINVGDIEIVVANTPFKILQEGRRPWGMAHPGPGVQMEVLALEDTYIRVRIPSNSTAHFKFFGGRVLSEGGEALVHINHFRSGALEPLYMAGRVLEAINFTVYSDAGGQIGTAEQMNVGDKFEITKVLSDGIEGNVTRQVDGRVETGKLPMSLARSNLALRTVESAFSVLPVALMAISLAPAFDKTNAERDLWPERVGDSWCVRHPRLFGLKEGYIQLQGKSNIVIPVEMKSEPKQWWNPFGEWSFWYEDPDGNVLEVGTYMFDIPNWGDFSFRLASWGIVVRWEQIEQTVA